MDKTTVVGHGTCQKCGVQTEIREIEWFLFPDDEQTEVIEVCLKCGFEVEKGFTSSNATTSFLHSISQSLKGGEKNAKLPDNERRD